MRNTRGSGLRRIVIGSLLWLIGAAAGCDGRASDRSEGGGSSKSDRVCPSCRMTVGGETGDFGASFAACAFAYAKRDVDRAQADALGFSASDAVRAIEEPIDAAMTWTAIDTTGGGPAHGYKRETHVHVQLAIDALIYNEFDPDKCDNPDCIEGGETGVCRDRFVMLKASGELHTDDDAVAVDLPSQDVRMLGSDDDDLSVAARADLHDVRGRLQLDPAIPEPRVGTLDLSLQYERDGALKWGVIEISITPDWDNLRTADGVPIDSGLELPEQASYAPLRGAWGSPPALSASTGRPEP